MLAGVDAILMGAGIPREIPQLIRDFADGKPGHLVLIQNVQMAWMHRSLNSILMESFGAAPKLAKPAFGNCYCRSTCFLSS